MLQSDVPFINLKPCASRCSDSDEFSESEQSLEVDLDDFNGNSSQVSSKVISSPSAGRFRSFSVSKVALSTKLSAEAQIRELEARLVDKENEVLLAADIGQVLLKEIDSLKYKMAAYEHRRPADDISQEIEINNTETVQKLRTFRVETDIYTSSFKEKPCKISESPYTPGRRSERSGNSNGFPLNDNDPDLTTLPPSALFSNKNTTSTLHNEINKAVESGENLMKLSRQLQTKLLDAERESLNLAEKCSELERQMAALKVQMTRGAENEAKSQENTWNLELQNQDLQTQVDELEQAAQKLISDQGKLQEALIASREVIEQLSVKEEKSNQILERLKTRHEQEIINIRKSIISLQREKAELNKTNEDLKSELSSKTQRYGMRSLGSPTPTLEPAFSGLDSPFELSDTYELPPPRSPLPSPFSTCTTGQTLQVETLTGSLGHAHRTIASLRSSLHREKIEKLEFKKMLAETQEIVENLQKELIWESEDIDKEVNSRPVNRRMRRKKVQIRLANNKHDHFSGETQSPIEDLEVRGEFIDELSPFTEDLSEFTVDSDASEHGGIKSEFDDLAGALIANKPIPPFKDQPVNFQRSSRKGTSRNPLTRRSTLNPMPSRDLLNELIMFDKQPEIEVDTENIEHDDSNNEVLEKKNQETQISFIETMPSICRFCGSSVTPTYISVFKEGEEVETTPTDNSLQIHEESSVKSEAIPHIVDNEGGILSNNEKISASIQVPAYPSVSLTDIQEFEDVESNTQRALFIDRIEPEADSSATCGAKISPIDEVTCSALIESATSIAQEAPTSEHIDSKNLQTSTDNVIGNINVPTTPHSKNVLDLNKSDFEISIPEEPSGNVESRSSEVTASAILENHEQPLKSSGEGYENSSDNISIHVQYLDVATQVSESLLMPWSKIDAATQTTDISTSRVPSESDNKLFLPPTRPTTQPPPGLMALSLSPIRVDMSSLRIADEIDFSKNPKAHQAVSHKRPPIPAAMLLRATPSMEIASDDTRIVNDRCNSDKESIATENSIGHDQVVAFCPEQDSSACTPTSIASTGPNYPASTSSARGTDTLSTYVTDSSLVSAEESWLNRRRTFSADPGIIHAITQAMIGDLMWKYTRRVIGTGISEKKHMRYFWIHPYTNTINWSIEQPGPDRAIGDINSNFKSACVRSIQVVQDPSTDTNASEFSLIIQTATRELKIKALGKEKHDVWLLALTYLQSRHGLSTPTAQKSINNLNEADQESPSHRRTHPSAASKTLDGLAPVPRNVSKKRSLVRLFHKPSKSSLSSSTVDAKNASNDIAIDEDIRKCCDGKHDLRKLDTKHS